MQLNSLIEPESQNFLDPGLTLVLVKSRVKKYRPGSNHRILMVKHNRTLITQDPVSVFQIFPITRVLY